MLLVCLPFLIFIHYPLQIIRQLYRYFAPPYSVSSRTVVMIVIGLSNASNE